MSVRATNTKRVDANALSSVSWPGRWQSRNGKFLLGEWN